MGELANTAKNNSNWLKVEIGESVIVKFISYKIIPSTMDPTKDAAQYKLLENGVEKYWTNGSGKVMNVFDKLEEGVSGVKIIRDVWKDKDGNVVEGKSSWSAEAAEAPEEAWDDDK